MRTAVRVSHLAEDLAGPFELPEPEVRRSLDRLAWLWLWLWADIDDRMN